MGFACADTVFNRAGLSPVFLLSSICSNGTIEISQIKQINCSRNYEKLKTALQKRNREHKMFGFKEVLICQSQRKT